MDRLGDGDGGEGEQGKQRCWEHYRRKRELEDALGVEKVGGRGRALEVRRWYKNSQPLKSQSRFNEQVGQSSAAGVRVPVS